MPPPLRLEISLGAPSQRWRLEREGERLVVGRSRGADLRLPAAEVSASHLLFSWGGEGWEVCDLGSANGSRLNKSALMAGQPRPFGPGDELQLASYLLRLVTDADADADADARPLFRGHEGTSSLAAELVRELLAAEGTGQRPWLRIYDPAGQSQRHSLPLGQQLRVGRSPGCELTLDDPDLSREHATLRVELSGVVYEDLQSKNGSFIGDERLAGARRLTDGDELRLGACRLRFQDPAEQWLASLDRELADEPPAPAHRLVVTDQARPPAPSAGRETTVLLALGLAMMLAAAWGLWRLLGG